MNSPDPPGPANPLAAPGDSATHAERLPAPILGAADNPNDRLQRLSLLYEVGRQLASLVRLDELLSGIVVAAAEVMQARASSLMLVEADGTHLTFEVAFGEKGPQLKGIRLPIDDTSIAGRVAGHGQPEIVNDVRENPFFSGAVDRTTEFVTRSILAVPVRGRGGVIGVVEVLNKISGETFSEDDVSLLTALAGSAAVAIENARLYEETRRRAAELAEMLDELQRTYSATMHALSVALDTRDHSTQGHSQRVRHYTLALAKAMGINNREQLEVIHYGALLHDVGKIGVPDAILHKPGKLTDTERLEMSKHPEIGYQMLKDIEFLRKAMPIVRYHHERWDGQGYPHHIAGEAIPIEARLFAVADVLDALTSERPYKPAFSYEQAATVIAADRGTHFDPRVVDAFLAIPPEEWQRLRDLVAAGDPITAEAATV